MTEYEKYLNELKEQILKEGDTLVSKRDLLERFCEIDKEYNGSPWNLLQILSNINILVGEEPSSSTQRWIPVSERLPNAQEDCGNKDFSDWVQVSIRITPYQRIVCSAYYCFSEKKWYMERVGCGEIIAWMPLPKPY